MSLPFVIGIAVLIGTLLFLYRQVRRFPEAAESGSSPKWRKGTRIALATTPLLVALLVSWSVFIEPARLVTRDKVIKLNDWPVELRGLKIVVLSDIHAGSAFIDDRKLRV